MPPARSPSLTLGRSFACLLVAASSLLGCGSTTDDRPAKWSFISGTMIEPACATVSCHSAVAQRAGVDLSARNIGYQSLLERHFVIPGNPDASEVLYLMHAQGSIRMPPDLPLPEADIALFAKWITDGATND